jgi:hypothetical protein
MPYLHSEPQEYFQETKVAAAGFEPYFMHRRRSKASLLRA